MIGRIWNENRRGLVLLCLVGTLFTFFVKAEADLSRLTNLQWSLAYTVGTLLLSLLVGSALGLLAAMLLEWPGIRLEKQWERMAQSGIRCIYRRRGVLERFDDGLRELPTSLVLPMCVVLLLLAWLPFYLAYYPGICAYDVPVQAGQIVSGQYNEHHPLAHTLLIGAAMHLGEAFGDINLGIACLTALQLLLLALSIAMGICLLHRRELSGIGQLAVLLLSMCYPFTWYMGVSITKDIFFTVFLLLFLTSLSDAVAFGQTRKHIDITDGMTIVGAIGVVLFRNNGKYALALGFCALLLAVAVGKQHRSLWKRLALEVLTGLVVGLLTLFALTAATGAEQADRREVLSLPMQQLARCMVYHGGVGVLEEDDATMSEEDRALINDFILDEAYREYDPAFADPVKRHVNTYVVRYRTADFLRTYCRLLVQYPSDYINAALALDAGFLSPFDTTHAEVNASETESGLGYAQTRWEEGTLASYGITKESKWPALFDWAEEWADDNAYLKLPLIKYLFVPGSFLWLYLGLAAILFYRRSAHMAMPLVTVFGYYATMLLGPTVQLRYLYPVMLALPFLLLYAVWEAS